MNAMNGQPRLLVADDDKDLTQLLALRCRAAGLAVDTAHDAMTAIRKIDESRPDLVVLDVNMPAGDGLSVCELMLRHEDLCTIPVIMLTGNSDQETIQRCHSLCAYYVPKGPDVWDRIEPLVTELLGVVARPQDNAFAPELPSTSPPGVGSALHEIVEDMSTIDRVFALFGWNDTYLEETPDERQTKEITRPWVLCIDDDSDFSFTLKTRLEHQGVEVLRAFAGMEGYRYAFSTQAEAIILDYEMPDGNGDYVLRRLKENPATKDIPVIVLTGRKEKSLERKMYALGASAFFTKPYEWNRLWAELKRHLPEPVAS